MKLVQRACRCIVLGLVVLSAPAAAQSPEPITAEAFLQSPGAQAFRDKRYEDAVTGFRALLEQHPDDVLILQYLGIALDRLERYDEAMEAFDRALELDPDNVPVLLFAGAAAFKQRDVDRAVSLMGSVVELAPGTPYAKRAAEYLAAIEQQRSTYERPGAPRRWDLYAQVGTEFDTNVPIAPSDSDEERNSPRMVQFVAGAYDIFRDGPFRLRGVGSTYQSQHLDRRVRDFDLEIYQPGVLLEYATTIWDKPFVPRFRYDWELVMTDYSVFSDAHKFETTLDVEPDDWLLSEFRHQVRVADFRENGFDPSFSSRSGVRNQVGLKQYFFFDRRRHFLWLAYDFELDDGDGENFDSHTHFGKFGASLGLPFKFRFNLGAEYAYQLYTNFAGPEDRRAARFTYSSSVSRPIVGGLSFQTGYDFIDEDSNYDVLEYDRHILSLALGYRF